MTDTANQGRPPAGGWIPFVVELLVEDLDTSLAFWRDALGFQIAYRRMSAGFVYMERPDGAQLMLSMRDAQQGRNETAALEQPFGRGIMFQLTVDRLDPVLDAVARIGCTVHEPPHEEWRWTGNKDRESGRREVKILDPNGYLVMLAEDIGERPARR